MGPHWFLPLIIIPTVMSPAIATHTSAPSVNYRLPTNVLPRRYDLELQPEIYGPDPKNFTFKGKVSITIVIREATSTITLHSHSLDQQTINQSARLIPLRGAVPAEVTKVRFDKQRQFLHLNLSRKLNKDDRFRLYLEFSGQIRDKGVGLYYASYRTEDGSTVYLATTHFEATHARKVFPCFDEPALKSTFTVTLVRRTNYNGRSYRSWSNNELLRTERRGNGYFADRFKTTPVMSTYLLAFIVADFQCLTGVTKHNVKYSTCARPNGYTNGRLMQDSGKKILERLEDTFDPPYPMSKIDNMAIPDFRVGAMENWGLVTYHQAMLYEEGVTTTINMAKAVYIVAHELAHQWFGNLVSPQWWSYLFLNEGFAVFWHVYLVGILRPQWRWSDRHVVRNMYKAMSLDSLVSSHSLTPDVSTPSEIHGVFDSITYIKGAAIIRMTDFVMGHDAFVAGLNIYLNDRQYKAANNTHLFDALNKGLKQQSSGSKDIARFMEPWLTQENYPVVHVQWTSSGRITLTQQRFLFSSSGSQRAGNSVYKWDIPITWATSIRPDFDVSRHDMFWFHKVAPEVILSSSRIPAPPTAGDVTRWVLLNVKQYGYYRVNYPDANWRALIHQLKTNHSVFPPINRAQIINDAWALVKAGHLSMSIALQTLDILTNDNDYCPWKAAVNELETLERMLSRTGIYNNFKNYVCGLVHHSYIVMGIKNKAADLPLQIFQREQIVRFACQYGMVKCKKDAKRLFNSWKRNPGNYKNVLDVDTRQVILCNGVRYGRPADWEFVFRQYLKADQGSYRSDLLLSLACSTKDNKLQRLMRHTLNSSIIDAQDVYIVLLTVSDNPFGRDVVFAFFKEHVWQLSESVGLFRLGKLVGGLTKHLNTNQDLQQLKLFMRQQNVTIAEKAFRKAVEQTTVNIQWMADHYGQIATFLSRSGSLTRRG